MTRFVLDASVAFSWIFEDERSAYADHVGELMKDDFAAVPVVWPLEIAKALDASYLELAMRRGLPLATHNERLASAATAAGVAILKA